MSHASQGGLVARTSRDHGGVVLLNESPLSEKNKQILAADAIHVPITRGDGRMRAYNMRTQRYPKRWRGCSDNHETPDGETPNVKAMESMEHWNNKESNALAGLKNA